MPAKHAQGEGRASTSITHGHNFCGISLIGETGHRIPYNHVCVCGGHRQSVEKAPGRVFRSGQPFNTGCEKDRLPTLATYTTMIMGQRKQQTRTDTARCCTEERQHTRLE